MYAYKLQAAAMLIVLYYIVLTIRENRQRGKFGCSKLFIAILVVSPLEIFFDGATAWTVNHLDTVPAMLNRILHLLFFSTMDILAVCVVLYITQITIGLNSWRRKLIVCLPGTIVFLAIHKFIAQLYYVEGVTTNYSMGYSVIIGYSAVMIYILAGIIVLFTHSNMIAKQKKISVFGLMGVTFILLSIQAIFPEALITSLFPAICIIVFYENFENPSIKQLHVYNHGMIKGFANLVESRDDSTGGHIHRTQGYVGILIREMRKDTKYRHLLNIDYVEAIIKAAPMHDIGKIATPDDILQKPGKLTEEEYEIMKEHAATGSELIKKTFSEVNDQEFLRVAYEVARYHHERWDGKGYPEGLAGEDIPLHARIMSIADVFDAVSAKRCYRDALPLAECFKIIEEGAGSQFDPSLASVFLGAKKDILAFYELNKE